MNRLWNLEELCMHPHTISTDAQRLHPQCPGLNWKWGWSNAHKGSLTWDLSRQREVHHPPARWNAYTWRSDLWQAHWQHDWLFQFGGHPQASTSVWEECPGRQTYPTSACQEYDGVHGSWTFQQSAVSVHTIPLCGVVWSIIPFVKPLKELRTADWRYSKWSYIYRRDFQ